MSFICPLKTAKEKEREREREREREVEKDVGRATCESNRKENEMHLTYGHTVCANHSMLATLLLNV